MLSYSHFILFRGKEVLLSLQSTQPQIIDYEGSRYRTDFWEGQGREYEDLAERAAIRRLLPPDGNVLIEIGAGFGRLADLYQGYNRVVLMDYSFSLLREARQIWGHDPRFLFVAASAYAMPFVDNFAEAMVMVRVMHHLQSPPRVLGEISRILQGGKTCVLEYANKRNLKSIGRYLARRQSWSPFAPEPYEFVELNFDFHPDWISKQLEVAGLAVERELAVSSFRMGALKRVFPAEWLARVDSALSAPGAGLKLTPSIFVQCRSNRPAASPMGVFLCPACHGLELKQQDASLACAECRSEWAIVDGIYDFREPVSRETNSRVR